MIGAYRPRCAQCITTGGAGGHLTPPIDGSRYRTVRGDTICIAAPPFLGPGDITPPGLPQPDARRVVRTWEPLLRLSIVEVCVECPVARVPTSAIGP